jgi:metal-responsive CopG/Arc/MetJ family transcriptional regulator
MLLETDLMADEPKDNRVPVMMGDSEIAAIDAWRAKQPGVPSRSEAIRRLVEMGLKKAK